jgi:Bacterial protein of unknown function (DUF885)
MAWFLPTPLYATVESARSPVPPPSTAACTPAAGAGPGPRSSRWRTRPCRRTFVDAEIDRYVALPGQALGYLTGQREILRLRDEARARLGAAFGIRDFHSAVLDHGSLPLAVLGQVVAEWAASVTEAEN